MLRSLTLSRADVFDDTFNWLTKEWSGPDINREQQPHIKG
jgi:hypothetical protein